MDLPAAFGPCKGMSPLEAAAGSGRSEIVNYLLDIRKAKLHVGCLAAACRKHDNHAVIRKLIQCGAQAEEGSCFYHYLHLLLLAPSGRE